MPTTELKHYFAFGSCMSLEDLRKTEPDAYALGVGRLVGWKLVFNRYSHGRNGGVADIIKTGGESDYVEGVVFGVPTFDNIDVREGHPVAYKRELVDVHMYEMGMMIECETYCVVDKMKFEIHPSYHYMSLLLEGAQVLTTEYQIKLRDNLFKTKRTHYRPPVKPKRKPLSDFNEYDEWEELAKRMGKDNG